MELIKKGTAVVSSGPLHMTIFIEGEGRRFDAEALEGGRHALKILKQLVDFLPIIKQRSMFLNFQESFPAIVNEMIQATKAIEDPAITPLAAVAGATSDSVADYLLRTEATKIIVNNGGDIAIRLPRGDTAKVGLCSNISSHEVKYFVGIDQDCGICTSGFGGRSFTLGVADSVVIISDRASLADAAATIVANKTNVRSKEVMRERAEIIFPDTDIVGKRVTVRVGNLSDVEVIRALRNGKKMAEKLIRRNLVRGAVLTVKDRFTALGWFKDKIFNAGQAL